MKLEMSGCYHNNYQNDNNEIREMEVCHNKIT